VQVLSRLIVRRDFGPAIDEVDTVHGFIVLADIVVAAGSAQVVESHARADDIDECRALVRDGCPPQRHQRLVVVPMISPSDTVSIGASALIAPRFDFDPWSAVAENWPLVGPYTPLFSRTWTMFTLRRITCANCPSPIDAESPSPGTPR
jgi:hypothetical protein